jgi:hypothetical protein
MKLKYILFIIILFILFNSCTHFVVFEKDYFTEGSRLHFDKKMLGYYKISYEDNYYLLCLLYENDNTYKMYYFDLENQNGNQTRPVNAQVIKVKDLLLIKLFKIDEQNNSPLLLLLKLEITDNIISIKSMLLNFEYHFLEECIQTNKLKGYIKKTKDKAGNEINEIVVEEDFHGFETFIIENYKLILKQLELNSSGNNNYIFERLDSATSSNNGLPASAHTRLRQKPACV